MAEEKEAKPKAAEAKPEKTAEERRDEQKIMCFVSKKMVPLGDTVELEYAPGKKVRVLPRYVKYDLESA